MNGLNKHIERLIRQTYYSDSFGTKGCSDYVDLAQDTHRPRSGTEMELRYTKRQRLIIAGELPEEKHAVSGRDLRGILRIACLYDDEDVIDAIHERYHDMLDEEPDDECEGISAEEFDEFLKNLLYH